MRAFVFDENTNALNATMSEQINSNSELMSELLENCIKLECEIEEETVVLEGDDIEVAKSEISDDIKEAEKQLIIEEENAQKADSSSTQTLPISTPSFSEKRGCTRRLFMTLCLSNLSFRRFSMRTIQMKFG